jgi:hypothetical protein
VEERHTEGQINRETDIQAEKERERERKKNYLPPPPLPLPLSPSLFSLSVPFSASICPSLCMSLCFSVSAKTTKHYKVSWLFTTPPFFQNLLFQDKGF